MVPPVLVLRFITRICGSRFVKQQNFRINSQSGRVITVMQFEFATATHIIFDTGKAIAAMLTNPGDLLDYLEVIGRAQPLANPSAPFIAIPTTAGTGSEVTRNAVLASPQHRVKVSLRSPFMLPRIALVDQQL